MGKRVRKALAASAAAAATGDPYAVAYNEAMVNAYNAKESTKKHGFAKFGPKEMLAKTKNSILNPKIAAKYIGDSARAGLKGSTADKRANLRGQHERLFKPFGNTAQNLTTADRMVRSGDPTIVIAGRNLQAEANKSSLKSGKRGIAVAAVVVAGYAFGGVSGAGSTMGKTIGTAGIQKLTAANKKKENATGGLSDTSDGNGDGMDPMTGARYREYMSDSAAKFFKTGAAAATGAGATSCGMAMNGEPWLFAIGLILFSIGVVWRVYGRRD